jgi:ABC-2 type transport system permease protein
MSSAEAVPSPAMARPLPLFRAARGVFDLALEDMIWSRRTVVLGILVGLPVLIALVYRIVQAGHGTSELGAFELYGVAVTYYYVGNVLPLAALFYATALIADEVEGRTLTYLLTRPIPRPSILLGKFVAYLVTSLSLAWPALVGTFFLLVTARGRADLAAAVPDLFRDAGVVALTLLSYGALFALLGVFLRRPLVPGLLFIFAWELVAWLPGYLPRLTLTLYLRSLVRHRPAVEGLSELFDQILPVATCLPVLFAASALFLGAALWIFSRREYVIQQ